MDFHNVNFFVLEKDKLIASSRILSSMDTPTITIGKTHNDLDSPNVTFFFNSDEQVINFCNSVIAAKAKFRKDRGYER